MPEGTELVRIDSSQESLYSTAPSSTLSESEETTQGAMLSVDFSTPLVGAARAERIKQITSNHPAFEKSRTVQKIVYNIQTSLRRMPGITSSESSEITLELQRVGQITSTETSQLVDAVANLELDLEDSKKAHVRLSIQEKLLAAEVDDKNTKIKDLRDDLQTEVEKREAAEGEVKRIMDDLTKLSAEFKAFKKNGSPKSDTSDSSDHDRDQLVKLEETIKHLEEQVNNRRSLWVMKHQDPAAVARAIESLAGSDKTGDVTCKAIATLRNDSLDGLSTPRAQNENGGAALRGWDDSVGSPKPSTQIYQPPGARQQAAEVGKYAGLAVGFQRPPSTVNNDRRMQSSWTSSSQRSTSFGQAPPPSGFGRLPARQGYQRGSGRYRNAVSDFNQNPFGSTDLVSTGRSGSSFSYAREQQPQRTSQPVTPQRGINRYRSSSQVPGASHWDVQSASADTQLQQNMAVSPLIHMTEASVVAWNEQIMDFYAVIRTFVERHASMPDYSSLVQLGRSTLWPTLLATYHPLSEAEATSYLDFHLKEESSKSCLVTRVIIDYVVNRVWVPAAWLGSDRESNVDIMRLEDDLEATQGQPSMLRQPLLDRQSAILDRIMGLHDKDSEFYKHKTEDITAAIMRTLGPLLNKLVHQADAFSDMQVVAETAWDLSSKILTSRLTFDFRFPEIGSRFSSQSMLPIWPAIDPMELQAKHWRVALVTTPVITCRNDTGTNISAHSVALADVVCMQ